MTWVQRDGAAKDNKMNPGQNNHKPQAVSFQIHNFQACGASTFLGVDCLSRLQILHPSMV